MVMPGAPLPLPLPSAVPAIDSAERHGLDPQAYLRRMLAKVGRTPVGELGQFLPDVWKAEEAASAAVPTGAISRPT